MKTMGVFWIRLAAVWSGKHAEAPGFDKTGNIKIN